MGYLTGVIIPLLCAAATSFSQCLPITVTGPSGVSSPGEKISFRAAVGAVGPKLEYIWKVDKGTIVEGQGTASITVQTVRELAGEIIVATVEVGGLPTGCAEPLLRKWRRSGRL